MLWERPCFDASRRWFLEKCAGEQINAAPPAAQLTGLILDDGESDAKFAEVALGAAADPDPPPPQLEDGDEMSVDSEGYLVAAGGGPAPSGQCDLRLRRPGRGVFYGPSRSRNTAAPLQGPAQNAQRSEVRTALRWAAWAWSRQVYIVDSDYVARGLQSIVRRRYIGSKSRRDLWLRIQRAILAKGEDNFKAQQVRSRQKETDVGNETPAAKQARET